MKLSQYTVFAEHYPEPANHLAYNLKTQGLAAIGEELRLLLEQFPMSLEALPAEARPAVLKLETAGIVLRDEIDEFEAIRGWFQTIRSNAKKLEVYLLTTYYCNFACVYCFEEGVKEKKFLSREKAEAAVRWIQDKAALVNPEKVSVVFYGGEPLLNVSALEFVAGSLHAYFKETPQKFEFSIITNGALAAEALIDRLNPWGLKMVRVTLDGPRAVHDQYRPTLQGKGTFETIIANVKAIADKTKVAVACNFNTASFERMYELLDYLEAEGLKEKLAMVDFKPITERREPICADSHAAPSYSSDPAHAQKMIDLKRELLRRGFKTSLALNEAGICHFKAGGHQAVIDPDGFIFKCPAMVGVSGKRCGALSGLELNNGSCFEADCFGTAEFERRCGACAFLPICAGGCSYHAELQTGSVREIFCEKDFFEKSIVDFVKIKYDQLKAKKVRMQGTV